MCPISWLLIFMQNFPVKSLFSWLLSEIDKRKII